MPVCVCGYVHGYVRGHLCACVRACVRCGAVQCSAVRYGAVPCRAVPCRALPCRASACTHRCAHARVFAVHASVCVCARVRVCATRSRPCGPSKSGRPVNIESKREAKTGQHRIEKGHQDRSTQIQEPDNTNPRASPRTDKNKPTRTENHTTRRPENKKKTRHSDSPNTTATKKRNHHYLTGTPTRRSDLTS